MEILQTLSLADKVSLPTTGWSPVNITASILLCHDSSCPALFSLTLSRMEDVLALLDLDQNYWTCSMFLSFPCLVLVYREWILQG